MSTQKYCIVGTERSTGIRKSISCNFSSREIAEGSLSMFVARGGKKVWTYVKIAKAPYKSRKYGGS